MAVVNLDKDTPHPNYDTIYSNNSIINIWCKHTTLVVNMVHKHGLQRQLNNSIKKSQVTDTTNCAEDSKKYNGPNPTHNHHYRRIQ